MYIRYILTLQKDRYNDVSLRLCLRKKKRNQKSTHTLQSYCSIIPVRLYSRSIDEDDTKKWEVRLFLEKDRGKVGRSSRVAPLVVIREEPSHRSPWALNRLPLAEGKKVGDIEKNGRDERKVRSGRGRSLSSRYPAHGSTFVFVILERKLESRNPSLACALRHVREYFSSSRYILLLFAQKRDSTLLT